MAKLGWMVVVCGLVGCAMAPQEEHADEPVWSPLIYDEAGCALEPFIYQPRAEALSGGRDGLMTLDQCIAIAEELMEDAVRWGEPVRYRCGRGCYPSGVSDWSPYCYEEGAWRSSYDETCSALVHVLEP